MEKKLITPGPEYQPKKFKTSWQFAVDHKQLILPQMQYLVDMIQTHGFKKIYNLSNFSLWNRHQTNSAPPYDLILITHTDWIKLSDLLQQIVLSAVDLDNNGMILLSVNKYLLLPEDRPEQNLNDNYDIAIKEFVERWFEIVDHRYNPDSHTGNVGNFVVPDNQFLLKCKKDPF